MNDKPMFEQLKELAGEHEEIKVHDAPGVPVPDPDDIDAKIVEYAAIVRAWNTPVTWTGTNWRPFEDQDLKQPKLMVAQRFRGRGGLDPSVWIITSASYKGMIHAMHKRWKALNKKS